MTDLSKQLLALRDIVVPEPVMDATDAWLEWRVAQKRFAETVNHLRTRDAIAEIEAIVRAKGYSIAVCENPDGWSVYRDEMDGVPLDEATATTEPAARFLAVIRAFIALGMVSEDQAGMIEGMRE